MEPGTSSLIGILLFALGGGLLLYSISYVVRDALVTSTPLSIASLGVLAGFLSFLLIGFGLDMMFQRIVKNRTS